MKSAHDDGSHEQWIPLLELATREVFELMMSSQLAGTAAAEEPAPEVTAMVGLAGGLSGVLSLRCDGKAAALMTSKLLGVSLDKVGSEVSDALGEICNMIAGNFKGKIASLAEDCMLSPPTVITGSDYIVHAQMDSPDFEVRLLFNHKPIVVSLAIMS